MMLRGGRLGGLASRMVGAKPFSTEVFVSRLSFYTTEEELKNVFSPFGAVEEARLVRDNQTGRPKGFGFVKYSSQADGEKAVKEMDGRVIGDGGDAVIGDGGGGLQRLPRRRPWSRGGGRAAPESTPPAKYARGRRPRRGSGGHAPHPESGGGGGGGGGAREWRDVGTTMRGGDGRGRGKSAQAADRCCRRMPMDGGPPTPTLAEVLSLSPPTTPRSRAPSSSRRRKVAAQTLATTAAGGQTAAEVARPPDSTPPAESGEEGGVGVHTGEEGNAAAAGEGSGPFFPIIAAPSLPCSCLVIAELSWQRRKSDGNDGAGGRRRQRGTAMARYDDGGGD
uniref:RRM domain-containing protein n=1 Tax=Oryza glumipatula TaxID=40148 RepID=A0A0D9Z5G3_9ORYZ